MSPENFIKAQLAAFAYREAAHCGGYEPMLAVACVLRNRVRRGWHGGDWQQVIEGARDVAGTTLKTPEPIDISSNEFRRVLAEIDDIFLGVFPDTFTSGGLYYLDYLYAQHGQELNPWFADKIMRDQANHKRVAQVAMLQIYS